MHRILILSDFLLKSAAFCCMQSIPLLFTFHKRKKVCYNDSDSSIYSSYELFLETSHYLYPPFLFFKEFIVCTRYIILVQVSGTSDFPDDTSGKEPACQCRRLQRCIINPWIRKIPWRRARQPTPVFLPGESHGQRSLVGYGPQGHKELDTTEVTQHGTAQEHGDNLKVIQSVSFSVIFFSLSLSLSCKFQYCFSRILERYIRFFFSYAIHELTSFPYKLHVQLYNMSIALSG